MPFIHNDILYITRQELLSSGVKENTLKSGVLRDNDSWLQENIAGKGKGIIYRSIPESTRSKLPTEAAFRAALESEARLSLCALVEKVLLSDTKAYEPSFADSANAWKYAEKAALLSWVLSGSWKKETEYTKKGAFYEALMSCEKFTEALGIRNKRAFQRVLKDFRDNGLQSCRHKGEGNTNRKKYGEWHEFMCEALFAMPMGYTARHIEEFLNLRAAQIGMQPASRRFVERHIAKPHVQNLAYETRYGRKAFEDRIRPYVPRIAAVYASDLWVMDGTRFNFAYDAGGRVAFMNCYVIMDACSRKIVGFSFSEKGEDRFVVLQAMQMAVELTGHAPYEWLHDNASSHKTEEFKEAKRCLEGLGSTFRAAKVGNAKDKTVERFFSSFDTTVGRIFPNWAGEGIRSKRKNARPNQDFTASLKAGSLPDADGLKKQVSQMIAIWNAQALGESSPNAIFAQSEKPYKKKVSDDQRAAVFWNKTTVTMRNGMVTIQVRKQKYVYQVPDFETRLNYTSDRQRKRTDIELRFDHRDLSEVFLFDAQSGEYLCRCEQYVKAVAANAGADKENALEIIRQEADSKAYEAFLQDKREAKREAAEQEAETLIPIELLNPTTARKEQLADAESQALLALVYDREGISYGARELAPVEQSNGYTEVKKKPSKNEHDGLYFKEGGLNIVS